MHQELFHHILTMREQVTIARAALLAHQGKHAEAEVVRFAADYHNLKEKTPK